MGAMNDVATPAPARTAHRGAVVPSRVRSIAYLNAQYPMLSMIFVIREVLQLKRLGFRIDVASINGSDRPPEGLTADERNESGHTYYVKAAGVGGALAAHARTLAGSPAGWWAGARLALRLGGADLRRLAMHAAYFTEGVMVGQWMRRTRQGHVHAHLGSLPATVGLYVKRVFDVGFSVTVHGPDEFYDAPGQALAEKVAAADFIVCISDFARSQLMKLSAHEHWPKLVVSRLGIDPSVFSPRPDPQGTGPFEILCVGRLTPAKGQHILLDAAAALVAQGRSIRLRIVGAGIDGDSLRRHAEALKLGDAIVFEGAVNQDRIRDLYARAHTFCLPSFAEGIPVVLMEAMAMEIPCVTTHITGIPELITSGVEGLLVPPSNVDALVQALGRLMDDPALRVRMGRAARQRVVADYDLAVNVERLARIFEERLAV
jgi:colanic acid/amylovoran biosynthesis glycosyltransferase